MSDTTTPAERPDTRRDAALSLAREVRNRLAQQPQVGGYTVFLAVIDESITRSSFAEIILLQLAVWSREGHVEHDRVWESPYAIACNIPNRTYTVTSRLRPIESLAAYPLLFTIDAEGKQWGNSFFDFFFSFLPANDYASLRALVIKRHIDNLALSAMGVRP